MNYAKMHKSTSVSAGFLIKLVRLLQLNQEGYLMKILIDTKCSIGTRCQIEQKPLALIVGINIMDD